MQSPHECKTLRKHLVDYADGVLDALLEQQLKQHLARCAACRSELDALHRSLHVAQSVWRADAQAVMRDRSTCRRSVRRQPMRALKWQSATALALLLGLLLTMAWLLRGRPDDPPRSVAGRDIEPIARPDDLPLEPSTEAHIEKLIRRREQITLLKAAARLLAQHEELRPYADKTRDLLATQYDVALPPANALQGICRPQETLSGNAARSTDATSTSAEE